MKDWLENLMTCQACHLRQEGNRGPTRYTGNITSPLMFVGEGPGGVEDEYGVPLVGPSGQLLDKALWSVGLTRDRVYVTNIVKCRPKNNRTPTLDEGRHCADIHLVKEIDLVQPKVIVCLGKVAFQYFYGKAPASCAIAASGSPGVATPSCRRITRPFSCARPATTWSNRNGRSITTLKPPWKRLKPKIRIIPTKARKKTNLLEQYTALKESRSF